MARWLSLAAALIALLVLPPAGAQAQPGTQPSKIIFPFAAGSGGDAVARLIAEKLRADLGRPFIVENRTGAAGRIGMQAAKASPADGSTLLLAPYATMSIYPHAYASLGYDAVADFVPLSQVAIFPFGLAVARNVPANSLAELVAWVSANPAQGNYGSAGAGSLGHLFGFQFGKSAGLDLRHVSYRGSGVALANLVAGQIPILVTSAADLSEHHRAGTVRVLATSGKNRSPLLPDVPTFRETGFDIEGLGWYAFYAPAKTPGPIVEAISKAIVGAVQSAEIRQRLLTLGLVATGTSPAQLAEIQKADLEYWGPIIKASGFTPEQ